MADENPPDLGRFSGTGPAPLDRARKHVHDHGPNDDSRGNAGTMEVFEPVEELTGDLSRGVIVICDHASGALPGAYGSLGLAESEFHRHIAYDIGAAALARDIASRLAAPAVLCRFSRLLIDPNRGEDDPTLIMRLSDGSVVPGNARLDNDERANRISRYYRPYHDAIARMIDKALAAGTVPAILSVHSFTAHWRGYARPWHAGILWDRDPRLAVPLIEALRREPDLVIGDNEPYSGQLKGDCLYRHGTRRGLAHALVEVRQDLLGSEAGISEWAERLAARVGEIAGTDPLRRIADYGSHSDGAGTRRQAGGRASDKDGET